MYRFFARMILCLFLATPCLAQPVGWNVLKGGFRFLDDVFFIDANNGFVVGFAATALRTTNGGSTWNPMPLTKGISPVAVISSVAFSSSTNGCMTYGDSILHTNDGGASWSHATIDFPRPVSRVVFATPQVGYATGGSINGGSTILKTVDGGASWARVHTPSDGIDVTYWGAAFRDPQHGMVISAHGVSLCFDLWRTSDGCSTWERITDSVIDQCSHELFAITHVTGTTWVIGGNSIERTTDDGTSWTKVSILPAPSDISFADSLIGYAAGTLKGTIYRTSDGGRSWKTQPVAADSPATVNAICAPTPAICYAIGGYYPTNLHDDVIIKTTDGGGLNAVEELVPNSPLLPSAYPNPATTIAHLFVEAADQERRIRVFDCLGRIVWTNTLPGGSDEARIPVQMLKPGIYWCSVERNVVKIGVVR